MGPFDVDDALKEYNKKFKDKSGNNWEDRSKPAKKGKYTFLERNYEDDEDDGDQQVKKEDGDEDDATTKVASTLPRQTQRLIELIFNQNHFNAVLENIGYNANKLPLGKLSKATLKTGFEHLHELASLIKHPSLSQNKYQISQEEVILAPNPSQIKFNAHKCPRLLKTSPTSTTPRFPTNLAATGLPRLTTMSSFGRRSRCSIP